MMEVLSETDRTIQANLGPELGTWIIFFYKLINQRTTTRIRFSIRSLGYL